MLDERSEHRLLLLIGRVAAYGLGIALLLWLLWQLRGVLPPFLVAFLLAVALAPVVERLEKRGLPRWAATTLVYVLVFGTLTGLVFVLVPIVINQIGLVVADLRVRFSLDQPADITRNMAEQIRVFGRRNEVPAFILQPIVQQAKNSASVLTQGLQSFENLLIGFIPNLIWFIIVPIVGFYTLIDYNRIFAKALLLVPRNSRGDVRGIASDVSDVFGKYLRGLLIVCLLDTAATISVLFWFPPTKPYCAALGLIAGILYAVPYLGALISTSLIALVALASPAGGAAGYMLWVTFTMILLHQVVFDQVVTPRVLGKQVGLHPILSILALVCGNALFGIGGMLIAVPLAASLQIVAVYGLPRLGRRIDLLSRLEPTGEAAVNDTSDPTMDDVTDEIVSGLIDERRATALQATSDRN